MSSMQWLTGRVIFLLKKMHLSLSENAELMTIKNYSGEISRRIYGSQTTKQSPDGFPSSFLQICWVFDTWPLQATNPGQVEASFNFTFQKKTRLHPSKFIHIVQHWSTSTMYLPNLSLTGRCLICFEKHHCTNACWDQSLRWPLNAFMISCQNNYLQKK